MVESFGVHQNEVGKWAGVCAAVFSMCQALMGIPWGRFSDSYGRKPAILLGLTSTMITTLIWGFSKGLPMAIVARALAGAGNGNVGMLRTSVAEMVPWKELQPRAFSIMPLVWNVGSILGPSIGGALANPYNVKPGDQKPNAGLLEMFPYALPNIVGAVFFAIGIITGILFLEETLEGAGPDQRKDYGLMLGKKLVRVCIYILDKIKTLFGIQPQRTTIEPHENDETEPLLKHTSPSEEDSPAFELQPQLPSPSWREVLNRQSFINLLVYALLAMHAMAFDQLIPVYLQHDPIGTPDSTPYSPPLKFAGGFGLNHYQIGLMSTCYGIAGIFVQFFIFPPLCRRLGVLYLLKVSVCMFPVLYILTPFTALLPTTQARVGCMFTLMALKCLGGIFAFPCNTILLTNSATSLRTLGTLNGIATSAAAVGRAAGPATAGLIFSVGVKKGYLVAPWWFLAGVATMAAIPVWWLVEGEGFGGDDEIIDEEEDDDEHNDDTEEVIRIAGLEGEAQVTGNPGPAMNLPPPINDEHAEHAYGDLAPMSRTTTHTSVFSADDAPVSRSLSGTASRTAAAADEAPSFSRRNSTKRVVKRKMSVPIGMGGQGISRRYSSNLGQSLGSAGSFQ